MTTHCDQETIIKNLRRVSGQVQGIEKMVGEKRDVSEIIQQLVAASSALKSVGKVLLEDYAAGCFGKKADEKDLQKVIAQLFKAL